MKKIGTYITLGVLLSVTACRFNDEIRPDPSAWTYADPSEVGLDDPLLLGLDSLIKGRFLGDVTSMLVLKDDQLVFENYYQFNTRDSLQNISSLGNSIISLLLGFAIQDGYIQSENDSIYLYLEDQRQYFEADPLKKGILIRHLLLMRSGISWNETLISPTAATNDYNIIRRPGIDRIAYLLSKPMESEAGQRFSQNSASSLLILKAIENQLPVSIEEYMADRLFRPLDITFWEVEKDVAGLANIAFGLKMKPLDLLKIGDLAMKNGMWEGDELLSVEWIEKTTSVQQRISNFLDIGYLWWRFSDDSSWAAFFPENNAFYASSDDSQYLFIMPSLNMVFILTTQQRTGLNSNIGYFILSNYLLQPLQPNSGN